MAANDNKLMTMKQVKTVRDDLRSKVAELTNGSVTALASGEDLDDKKTPGVYTASNDVANSLTNSPAKFHFRMIVMYGSSTNNVIQVVIDRSQNAVWTRTASGSTFTRWAKLITSLSAPVTGYNVSVDKNNYKSHITDLNSANVGNVYYLNQCLNTSQDPIANVPAGETGTSGFLLSAAGSIPTTGNQSQVQFLFMTNGHIWFRLEVVNVWSEWTQLNEFSAETEIERYYVNTCVDRLRTRLTASDKFVVFGDSIATMAWVGHFRDALGIQSGNVVNKAVGGAVWGHTASARPAEKWISTQVAGMTAADWENAKLVILAAGTNDADYSGNITTAEIRTQVQAVIDTVKAAAPNAHLLFITPIRRGGEAAMKKLPAISGAIANVALENDCSVINGFDIPIPVRSIDGVIDDLTSESDSVHPNAIGQKVYARAVIGCTQ